MSIRSWDRYSYKLIIICLCRITQLYPLDVLSPAIFLIDPLKQCGKQTELDQKKLDKIGSLSQSETLGEFLKRSTPNLIP